jgi:Helix-turn-helix domain
VSALNSKLTPTERRKLVALKIRAGKSNRTIAKELEVDEGTVRRDRKFLETPKHLRPVRKERTKNPKRVKPAYNPDDNASLELHQRRMPKVLRLWIAEQKMVLTEIEYVLHEAGKRLYLGRDLISNIPLPTQRPAELMAIARPDGSVWGDFIPNPDFWADWLARWLALCLPREHALHERVLRETSLWARSQ